MFFDFLLSALAKWDGESVKGREEEGGRGERDGLKTRASQRHYGGRDQLESGEKKIFPRGNIIGKWQEYDS